MNLINRIELSYNKLNENETSFLDNWSEWNKALAVIINDISDEDFDEFLESYNDISPGVFDKLK